MKKVFLSLLVLASLSLAFTNPEPAPVSYNVDTTASKVAWKGYKVTGQHEGTIKLKEGSLDFQDGVLKGGSFVIDMSSIQCTDLEGAYAGKLEGHLKSEDFFGVEKFPTARFEITNVTSNGVNRYKVVGNLTIKETTKEIKFITDVKETSDGFQAEANIQVDRSEYDVRYGSGSFFDSLGDKTIYDEFDLVVSLQANPS